jgi:hypothetical protein
MVVELGVGQHGDLGLELQQRAVRLVGLHHDPFAAPPPRVRIGAAQLAADQVGGIEPAGAQPMDDHARRRRLAVGAGDRKAALQRGDLGQQVSPVELAAAGRETLGIVGRDGGGIDDLRPGRHIGLRVPDHRDDAVLAQALGV